MRLLFATSERGFRGGERQALQLAQGLVAAGDAVELAAPADAELHGRWPGTTHPVPMANTLDLRGRFALGALLRRGGFQLVHAFTPKAHALLPSRPGLPRVVTRSVAFTAGKGPFGRAKYRRGAEAFVAVSSAVVEALLTAGAPQERVHCIAPGIVPTPPDAEAGRALRLQLGLGGGDLLFAAIGALEQTKGHDLALEALATLPAHVRLAVLGEGERGPALRAQTQALGLASRVHWLGSGSVGALLGAAQGFVFPSRREGFGLALVEAMAAGLPCVVADSGGVRDIATDGLDVLLVPSGSAKPLAEAMARLIDDEPLRSRLGLAARSRGTAFLPERMVEATRALYLQLLKAPHPP